MPSTQNFCPHCMKYNRLFYSQVQYSDTNKSVNLFKGVDFVGVGIGDRRPY